MCGSRRRDRKPQRNAPGPMPVFNPAPAAPPPPPPAAPAPPPKPRRVDNFVADEGGTTFKPGKKKKKDRAQLAKGTGQLRIPRTGTNMSGGTQGGTGATV